MASPDDWKRCDIDGLDFLVEVWEDRVLCMGPAPADILFYSFNAPYSSDTKPSWGMIEAIISRRVTWYIDKHPVLWKKYWGEDGVYAQMGRNK